MLGSDLYTEDVIDDGQGWIPIVLREEVRGLMPPYLVPWLEQKKSKMEIPHAHLPPTSWHR